MNYSGMFLSCLPEVIIVATALIVLLDDLVLLRTCPRTTRGWAAVLVLTFGCTLAIWRAGVSNSEYANFGGMLDLDGLGLLMKQVILTITILVGWITIVSDFTEHVGEYFVMLLLGTVGMMLLVTTRNLLMVFLCLELLSLALYIITGFSKSSVASSEAALKYFLFGGMSAALLLFGLSLIYGITNNVDLTGIGSALSGKPLEPIALIGILMIVAGFGFKVAAVPFHLWAPDAYQGAPGPAAAFIASGSKVASFFILAKFVFIAFAQNTGSAAWHQFATGWMPILAVIAVLSMVLGNLAAIAQSSVRRLLAYSAIAQAGYMILGLLAGNADGLIALLYYVITYALTVLGAFAIVILVQENAGHEQFAAFAGLAKRAPVLSFCMMLFLLSLAGIPPLAGFFGKFYLFTSAMKGAKDLGLLSIVLVALGASAVSLYYYLIVLRQIYVAAPAGTLQGKLQPSPVVQGVIILLAAAVLLLGCFPGILVSRIQAASKQSNSAWFK